MNSKTCPILISSCLINLSLLQLAYPPLKMSADEIATAFIQHYYTTLDSNPAALASLYVSYKQS